MESKNDVLKVENLTVSFPTEHGPFNAVDDVSFEMRKKQVLGIVGESGSGKTMTALSIMRLIPSRGRVERGRITFFGSDLLSLSGEEMRAIRGARISMIFQDPMTSLNPSMTIGEQVAEAVREHRGLSKRDALREGLKILESVGLPDASRRLSDYPHQLSGGMQQRVMIATRRY
jgi:ABC-type dipeptide/oligopeptide/nickel transport system ATPase component